MSDLITLSAVSKSYVRGRETIHAVRELDLTIGAGEFVAIVGPSGSGKSTLLHLLGCVDRPDSGTLLLDGQAVSGADDRVLRRIRSEKIGFVFQQFFLLPTLTALENVLLPTIFTKGSDRTRRAAELLGRVGLGQRGDHLPKQLSGGEMQRVAIARALVNEPRILLADEPTGSLDSRNAEGIVEIFRELNASGLTILMVTHNQELADRAGRIVRLRDGRVH